jgi:hypothetical protein
MSNARDDHVQPASEITEDGPVMRSVAIMRPQSMSPLDSFQRLSLNSDKQFMYQNNALIKPQVILSESKVQPTSNVDANPWNVTKALPLPTHYQLDRSHVRVSDASCLEISKRIADYFFTDSIASTFDTEKVSATKSIKLTLSEQYQYSRCLSLLPSVRL